MRNKYKKLQRDEIRRKIFLKKEIQYILLKSILKNQQITPTIRCYLFYKLQRLSIFFTKQKNFCLLTGRGRGVWKFANLSRHQINKYAQTGFLVGYKPNNTK